MCNNEGFATHPLENPFNIEQTTWDTACSEDRVKKQCQEFTNRLDQLPQHQTDEKARVRRIRLVFRVQRNLQRIQPFIAHPLLQSTTRQKPFDRPSLHGRLHK